MISMKILHEQHRNRSILKTLLIVRSVITISVLFEQNSIQTNDVIILMLCSLQECFFFQNIQQNSKQKPHGVMRRLNNESAIKVKVLEQQITILFDGGSDMSLNMKTMLYCRLHLKLFLSCANLPIMAYTIRNVYKSPGMITRCVGNYRHLV